MSQRLEEGTWGAPSCCSRGMEGVEGVEGTEAWGGRNLGVLLPCCVMLLHLPDPFPRVQGVMLSARLLPQFPSPPAAHRAELQPCSSRRPQHPPGHPHPFLIASRRLLCLANLYQLPCKSLSTPGSG